MECLLHVETNFLVSFATGRDDATQALLVLPPAGVRFVLPSICIMEAMSNYEVQRKGHEDVVRSLTGRINEFKRGVVWADRSQRIDAIVQARVELNTMFGQYRSRLMEAIRYPGLNAITIGLDYATIGDALIHPRIADPTDNLILSSVVTHALGYPSTPKALLTEEQEGFPGRSAPGGDDRTEGRGHQLFQQCPGMLELADPAGPTARDRVIARPSPMPTDRKLHLNALVRRVTGAKKIALFGHRAVGKTTLLAMFYREASSGRVPGIRMAAIGPSTAEYLAARIAQIESGEPLAGTLAETELKLRLYHGPARFDLIVKDYQGEHVTLGAGPETTASTSPTATPSCSASTRRPRIGPPRGGHDSKKWKSCLSGISRPPTTPRPAGRSRCWSRSTIACSTREGRHRRTSTNSSTSTTA